MHTHVADGGTRFHHNGDYSGDVTITVHAEPETLLDGGPFEHIPAWRVSIPFGDVRELVFAYLRARKIEQLEQAGDDVFEAILLGSDLEAVPSTPETREPQ